MAYSFNNAEVIKEPTSSIAEQRPISKILHSNIRNPSPQVVSAQGIYLTLEDGRKILDATGGPGVVCIGHGNVEVRNAVTEQMACLSYCHAFLYSNSPAEELAQMVIDSTTGTMAKATIMGSGSEATESAMKLARQYYVAIGQPKRTRFIGRRGAFHGLTLGALGSTMRDVVRTPYEPLIAQDNVSFVSTPNTYRDMKETETVDEYVKRLADELDDEFQRVGPGNVCAFMAETVTGSSNGCMTAPLGYFRAVRAVCTKHSALLILDEIICGMGRVGAPHAWQLEGPGVEPDLQTVAKGVCGGYASVSMLLMNQKVVDGLKYFAHGHTFSSHAVACAAAVAVQKVVARDGLVVNAAVMGVRLGEGLRGAIGNHPHVGDVRGRGLLWAIEFVENKKTKKPFDASRGIAGKIREIGMKEPWNISLYPGTGTADGVNGDHVMIAPPFTITEDEVYLIVRLVAGVVEAALGSYTEAATNL